MGRVRSTRPIFSVSFRELRKSHKIKKRDFLLDIRLHEQEVANDLSDLGIVILSAGFRESDALSLL
jgi:hypothetical protein